MTLLFCFCFVIFQLIPLLFTCKEDEPDLFYFIKNWSQIVVNIHEDFFSLSRPCNISAFAIFQKFLKCGIAKNGNISTTQDTQSFSQVLFNSDYTKSTEFNIPTNVRVLKN